MLCWTFHMFGTEQKKGGLRGRSHGGRGMSEVSVLFVTSHLRSGARKKSKGLAFLIFSEPTDRLETQIIIQNIFF